MNLVRLSAQDLGDGDRTPPPPLFHDDCQQAITLHPGDKLMGLSNKLASLGPLDQTPADLPNTCIESFENDLWFKFTTTGEFDTYEIIITHGECNTPAGLQALLIKANSCNRNTYQYIDCSNFENTEPISLVLVQDLPDVNYLIYVDGFDGTICEFTLEIKGKGKILKNADWYSKHCNDYAYDPTVSYEPDILESTFLNNAFLIEWQASAFENTDFYLIERVFETENGTATRVAGIVTAKQLAGGADTWYEWIDDHRKYQQGLEYCYRLVAVDAAGNRKQTPKSCVTADLVLGIYLHFPEKAPSPGSWQVTYINKFKEKDIRFQVLNNRNKELKGLVMKKEPVRDGVLTIDMSEYPAGDYKIVMQAGKESFTRKFHKTD